MDTSELKDILIDTNEVKDILIPVRGMEYDFGGLNSHIIVCEVYIISLPSQECYHMEVAKIPMLAELK